MTTRKPSFKSVVLYQSKPTYSGIAMGLKVLGALSAVIGGWGLLKLIQPRAVARATTAAQPVTQVVNTLAPNWDALSVQWTNTALGIPIEPPSEGQSDLDPTADSNGQVCSPLSPLQSAAELKDFWQLGGRWAENIRTYAQQAIATLGPAYAAYVQPVSWPQIHNRARMARVPVLMYHDILPEMQVFFDVTPEQLEAHFQMIQDHGLTPVSLDQLVLHLRSGVPLPAKPVLLTFDDGYVGHYDYVYPLLKRYGYPAVFSVFTDKLDGEIVGRSTLTWEQLKVMAADPLVTIAAHSVTHPADLREVSDGELEAEVQLSKSRLESVLGKPIRYFTYPEGKHDERVMTATAAAGYVAALAMDDADEVFAGESESLLNIGRFGQSRIEEILDQAWGGPMMSTWDSSYNFSTPVQREDLEIEGISITLITGGKPITIHAKSRDQVPNIIAETPAIAAVDGAFFNMEYLDSNAMIGPVYSQVTGEFVPGGRNDIPFLEKRPLVLISADEVRFVPFDSAKHNDLAGIQAEMAKVTDAFVGAAWLVRGNEPQPDEAFGDLFDFNAERHRAFWGLNQAGQPVIGVTHNPIGSVDLGKLLAEAGLRDAVMLDSGASTSLAYEGESLVGYEPRPVPHVVALVPPEGTQTGATNTDETGAEGCVTADVDSAN